MYKTFEEFQKNTAVLHSALSVSGLTMKLSEFQDQVAKSAGFKDTLEYKSSFDIPKTIYIVQYSFNNLLHQTTPFYCPEKARLFYAEQLVSIAGLNRQSYKYEVALRDLSYHNDKITLELNEIPVSH